MPLLEWDEDYAALVEEAEAIVLGGAPIEDETGAIRTMMILLLEQHKGLHHVVNVQMAVIEQIGLLRGEVQPEEPEEPVIPLMPKPEFTDRFVDAFRALAKDGSGLPPGQSASAWALQAVDGYYADVSQRNRGPEACAQHEHTLLVANLPT